MRGSIQEPQSHEGTKEYNSQFDNLVMCQLCVPCEAFVFLSAFVTLWFPYLGKLLFL